MEVKLEWIERIPFHEATWLFVSLFLLLGFFAWIRNYYGNILVQTVQASVNFQVAARMFKDNSLLQNQLDRILYVFYFLSFAQFLYVLQQRYELHPYQLNGFGLYLFDILILAAIFMIRILLVNLLGLVFNRRTIFQEYLHHNFIFNKLIGMVIVPLLIFVVYTRGFLGEAFLFLAMATVLAVFVMRSIRGIVYSFKKGISIFYMFLYLCALEMAPLILLYRWLEGIL